MPWILLCTTHINIAYIGNYRLVGRICSFPLHVGKENEQAGIFHFARFPAEMAPQSNVV